jgi:hypothetical protein
VGKFDALKQQLLSEGISEMNIDYAVLSIQEGVRRELIMESLQSDYRGMNYVIAGSMLDRLYEVYGGEFKKENRSGYAVGIMLLLLGVGCSAVALYYWRYILENNILKIMGFLGLGFTFIGAVILFVAIRGKYRYEMNPLQLHDDDN